jgi:restriction endonuclease
MGRTSNPDFVAVIKRDDGTTAKLVIDAKSHLNHISDTDVRKMISDC